MRSPRDEAFHEYVSGQRGDLLRTATMLAAGDRHLAEDLVQISLTRLYLAWPRLQVPDARHAYARKTLASALIDEARRPWRRREHASAELAELLDGAVEDGAADDVTDERLARLRPALAALPPRMRAAVVFRHLHGLSVAETADLLNCSQGTVKSQTSRGLGQLRRALDLPVGDDDEDEDPALAPRTVTPRSPLTSATTSWSTS